MPDVLIADEQPLFRAALRSVAMQVFEACDWHHSCIEAASMGEVMRIAGRNRTLEAVLLDLSLLGTEASSQIMGLRSRLPAVPLIVLSATSTPQTIQLCLACGVAGFVPKSSSQHEVAAAIRTVFEGGIHMPASTASPLASVIPSPIRRRAVQDEPENEPLSGRQAAVVDLLTDGKSNKQIAWELAISETTVKAHMSAILRKLGVNSRAQAIVLLLQRQLMRPMLPGLAADSRPAGPADCSGFAPGQARVYTGSSAGKQ